MTTKMPYHTPKQIVDKLGKYVIGQHKAKVAVAIALRSRWRRLQVEGDLRYEISPKNILMVGSTGVGKTEIARRLADLSESPFVKIEATKFTEVGYVGRDVDSIIRDLVEVSMSLSREKAEEEVFNIATEAATTTIANIILNNETPTENEQDNPDDENSLDDIKQQIQDGELDDHLIEIDITRPSYGVEIMAPAGMEEMSQQLQDIFTQLKSDKPSKKKMPVKDALRQLTEEEAGKLINEDEIRQDAIDNAEQKGIVFIDEIDKVIKSQNHHGDVSREGVQRDLLPLLEGTTVHTKYGPIETDHILFIASGAFMGVSPKDMISELQGRLPIRVNLESLTEDDFRRILSEPENSLTKQYSALMKTEGITLNFTPAGIKKIAKISYDMNAQLDNIGARRLHTVMENLLEKISYDIETYQNTTVKVDAAFVTSQMKINAIKKNDEKWML